MTIKDLLIKHEVDVADVYVSTRLNVLHHHIDTPTPVNKVETVYCNDGWLVCGDAFLVDVLSTVDVNSLDVITTVPAANDDKLLIRVGVVSGGEYIYTYLNIRPRPFIDSMVSEELGYDLQRKLAILIRAVEINQYAHNV